MCRINYFAGIMSVKFSYAVFIVLVYMIYNNIRINEVNRLNFLDISIMFHRNYKVMYVGYLIRNE